VTAAWLAHLYTATGAVLAFLAAVAVIEGDYRTGFFWLAAQVFVDATDGLLARAARVKHHLPWFDGAKLDDIVDYLTYVFVPALAIWRVPLVKPAWGLPVVAAILLSSAYAFNRADAKTEDHFFTGFPSYWNVVVLYLLFAEWDRSTNLAILASLIVLVFVPIRYVYPSRTPIWQLPTNVLGGLWGVAMLVMLWQYPQVSRTLFLLSLIFPVYYLALSLVLQRRRRSSPLSARRGA
jgi:phosphatidylcholine synthase